MITLERLRELLDYDPNTGEFTWKVDKSLRAKAGSIAGHPNFCHIIGIDGKTYTKKRLVELWNTGKLPPAQPNVRTSKSGVPGIHWLGETNTWHVKIKLKPDEPYRYMCSSHDLEEAKELQRGYLDDIARGVKITRDEGGYR